MTYPIFLTAKMAREKSRNNVRIQNEIRTLEDNILEAVQNGKLSTIVSNSGMTINNNYYLVWKKMNIDKVLSDEMEQVISFFKQLGFNIVRKEENHAMVWQIDW